MQLKLICLTLRTVEKRIYEVVQIQLSNFVGILETCVSPIKYSKINFTFSEQQSLHSTDVENNKI